MALVAVIFSGSYVVTIVTRAAIDHTAAASALLVDSMLMPHMEPLSQADELPPALIDHLDEVVAAPGFADRFPHVDIWRPDGVIVYSRSRELIGMQFLPPEGLDDALEGGVSARYTDLSAREHVAREFDTPFLEIYVPIREHQTGRIIAVAEIHEDTGSIQRQLQSLQIQTWLMVVTVALIIMAGLFWIVHQAARLIGAQEAQLRADIAHIETVSEQNRILRERAQIASSRVSELTERQLRRISADLHDGPAQLVSYGILGMEHIRQAETTAARETEISKVHEALNDALRDIRILSKGLLGPDISHLLLEEVIARIGAIHTQRTGTTVKIETHNVDREFPDAIKICVYRFLQEGLNNAFRHAGGVGQSIECTFRHGVLDVVVKNKGNIKKTRTDPDSGMGLVGLRHRVESLGGTFVFANDAEGNTRMEMSVAIAGL